MVQLIIFNGILLCIISAGLVFVKRHIRGEKGKNWILLCAALLTILFHYSSFLFLLFTGGDTVAYLKDNPNLLLPIYPCNVAMWGCFVFGCLKNKMSKVAQFLADYLFWFGIFSTLVGMFANVDFLRNPTFQNYEVTKSIVAHATLLFNVLLLFLFGYAKVDLPQNMTHIAISVVMMYLLGQYCNTLFAALVSSEAASSVNSMYILHSPFPEIPFLTYPIIAGCALPLYFLLFTVCEFFVYPKGSRWFNRIKSAV